MNRTEAHPVELAIVAALVVFDALLVLVVAAAAVVLVSTERGAGQLEERSPLAPVVFARAAIEPIPAEPQQHPLALLATELEALPAATLRAMAGIRSKRHTKAALVAMVIACS